MLILTSTLKEESSISSLNLKMPVLSPSEIMLFQPPRGFMFNAEEKKISSKTAFLFKPSIGYQWLPEDTKFSRTWSPLITEVNIHTFGEIQSKPERPGINWQLFRRLYIYFSDNIKRTIKEDPILELAGLGLFCYYCSINHICKIRL